MDAVLNWVLQGCVVAVALFVMLRVLDRARANVRYVVCWTALLLIIVLPFLPWLLSAPPPDAFLSARGAAIVSLPDSWWTSTLVMLAAWLTWASVCTVRFGSAMLALRRARACSRAFPSHVESDLTHWTRVRSEGRRATLVVSDSVTTAAVLPWGAPMIAVAPSLVRTLEAADLDRVLIHEWAHVQRRDDLVNILHIVVRILAGWHPAVWWIDRRLNVEREIACDEATVAITGSPKSYAACLMKLASVSGTVRGVQGAPALFTVSGLRRRVTKIVTPHPAIAAIWSRSIAAAIVSTLCAVSVGVGGLELIEATALSLPGAPARMVRLGPPVLPTLSLPIDSKPSPRRTTLPATSAQRRTPQQAPPQPSPLPDPKPGAPIALSASDPVNAGGPIPPVVEAGADRPAASETATVAHTPESQSPAVQVEQPRSPWSAAADGGVALGRKSKDAGVATAGFFSRFAHRVAGSF
jgi:bla regulator protein blaR1